MENLYRISVKTVGGEEIIRETIPKESDADELFESLMSTDDNNILNSIRGAVCVTKEAFVYGDWAVVCRRMVVI